MYMMYTHNIYIYIYLPRPRTYQNDSEDAKSRLSAVNTMEHTMQEDIGPWHVSMDISFMVEVFDVWRECRRRTNQNDFFVTQELRFQSLSTFYRFFSHSFFPKQFTVGVLNATLDLAALVLVGVAAFLGSEVVLAPFGSLHVGVGVGWCGRLLGLWSGLGSLWLPSCAMRKKRWAEEKNHPNLPTSIWPNHTFQSEFVWTVWGLRWCNFNSQFKGTLLCKFGARTILFKIILRVCRSCACRDFGLQVRSSGYCMLNSISNVWMFRACAYCLLWRAESMKVTKSARAQISKALEDEARKLAQAQNSQESRW